jgi:hypothetical protein
MQEDDIYATAVGLPKEKNCTLTEKEPVNAHLCEGSDVGFLLGDSFGDEGTDNDEL